MAKKVFTIDDLNTSLASGEKEIILLSNADPITKLPFIDSTNDALTARQEFNTKFGFDFKNDIIFSYNESDKSYHGYQMNNGKITNEKIFGISVSNEDIHKAAMNGTKVINGSTISGKSSDKGKVDDPWGMPIVEDIPRDIDAQTPISTDSESGGGSSFGEDYVYDNEVELNEAIRNGADLNELIARGKLSPELENQVSTSPDFVYPNDENINFSDTWNNLKSSISSAFADVGTTIARVGTTVSGVGTTLANSSLGKAFYSYADASKLNLNVLGIQEDVFEIIRLTGLSTINFDKLNEKTKEKLQAKGITRDSLEEQIYGCLKTWFNKLDSISSNIEEIMKKTENTNSENSDVSSVGTGTFTTNGYHHSSGSSSSVGDSNVEVVTPGVVEENAYLLASVVGTITLKEIVPLYETIGNDTGLKATLEGNYGVIGIVKEGDKYYYKLIDKATNKVYFTEINEKVQITTEYTSVLAIKENAMMLNSTEIGADNNFVKLADPNTLYFIKGEVESNGIAFANVLDGSDGKEYFIPLSDSVEVLSLESITNVTGQKEDV